MTRHPRLVLGVDAGGSKTAAWLATAELPTGSADALHHEVRRVGHEVRDALPAGRAAADPRPKNGPTDTASVAASSSHPIGSTEARRQATLAQPAWMPTEHGVLGRGQAGGANPREIGFEAAWLAVRRAIDLAFADAGMLPCTVSALCLGMAGAGRTEEQKTLTQLAQADAVAEQVRVIGDAEPLLPAAFPDAVGVALISGTGSLAWGRDATGGVQRSGGWGYLLGDEGSGYWLAMAALQAVAKAIDGRGPQTALIGAALQHFQVSQPPLLIGRIYDLAMTRGEIARFCPLVFQLMPIDPVARQVIERGADELAMMVASLARRLGLKSQRYQLALAGGVLRSQPRLQSAVLERLIDLNWQPADARIVEHPAWGAVQLARALAESRSVSADPATHGRS
jgi:N-acetylglucosamine kinase-like BadF-type ATPase